MKLFHKLAAGFSAVALLILAVGYYTFNATQEELQKHIGHESEMLARETLDKIDRDIAYHIDEFRAYTKDLILQEAVIASNRDFGKLDNIQEYFYKKDREWTAAPKEEITPFMRGLINNELSEELTEKIKHHEEIAGFRVFGEVFVTNKYGANIAMTGKTTDYRQDDEEWWQTAKRDGLYLKDVGYDDSADIYSVDVVMRTDDQDGNFLGLIKVVLNIEEAINIIKNIAAQEEHKSGRFKLVTKDGRLIYSTVDVTDTSHLKADIEHHGRESIKKSDGPDAETEHIVHAHSNGFRDYKGLGWILLVEHDTREVFAPVYNLRKRSLFMSMAVAAFGIVSGLVLSAPLIRNIRELKNAALKIGKGELDTNIDIESKDEIGELAASFKQMADDLKTTTVSRDKLAGEVAERRCTEEKLKQASAKLEHSNAELQQFAYIASHDLQEPLRMVTSYVQLLEVRYKGKLDAEADEFIGFAVEGATRMKTQILDILTYSRLGTHGREFKPTDCAKVLKQTLEDLHAAIVESGAIVTGDPLPEVMADETQLPLVFRNLIGNAVKFRGDSSPRIHISSQEKDNEWSFSVKDNGIGIASEYYDRIFGVFQRLHNRKEYPGTGIGLAICKKIVQRHGGGIWVESGPDNGSTFYFTVPKGGGQL